MHWSTEVLEEATRNLVADGLMDENKAVRLRRALDDAFPEALVENCARFIPSMTNHPKDRHVVAAALRTGAQVIVTSNIRDFSCLPADIEAQTPDTFLAYLWDLRPLDMLDLLQTQASDHRKPPVDLSELLRRLAGFAPTFVASVRMLCDPR